MMTSKNLSTFALSFQAMRAIAVFCLLTCEQAYSQPLTIESFGQPFKASGSGGGLFPDDEFQALLDSEKVRLSLHDSDASNNAYYLLVDRLSISPGSDYQLSTSILEDDIADGIDGIANICFVCRELLLETGGDNRPSLTFGRRFQFDLLVTGPIGGVRCFILAEKIIFVDKEGGPPTLLNLEFNVKDPVGTWGGGVLYSTAELNSKEIVITESDPSYGTYKSLGIVDSNGRVARNLRDAKSPENKSVASTFLDNRMVVFAKSVPGSANSSGWAEPLTVSSVFSVGALDQAELSPTIADATTLWKSRYLKYLNTELQTALLVGDFPKIYSTYKKSRELPFSNVANGPSYSAELGENAKQLREQLISNLPGIVKEELQDDLPGGKATLQMFGVPKKGQFRIAPHESPVAVLGNNKLGTVTYDSGNESFEVIVDVELGVSPAAIKPAKQYIGKVFEYAGTQPIKVTDIACSFPGIAGVKFNDLGSGRLKLSFVLKGDKSGLALTQFANNIGVPIEITADVEGEGDVVQFSSIYTVSLAKRNRSDVSISGGSIHNLSSKGVYVGWLADTNGEVFLPKDGRPIFVDANKEISVDMFSDAGAATKVPPAALEYVVSNPLQELDFQDTNAIEKLAVTNGILPVFQQAGVEQFLSYVEVEISESWGSNTIKHGPFLLSPKNANGSDLTIPLIKHPDRELTLTGRLVFSNGGFKNLETQTIDGLSLLINTQMIE